MVMYIIYDIALWFLFFPPACCHMNITPVSQYVVSGEDSKSNSMNIHLFSWNPITPSSFGAHVNTASCEDELLPISCVHRVLCIPESRHLTFGPLGHNKHAFCSYSTRMYFQTSAVGQVKNK